jgi:hypothetical protein
LVWQTIALAWFRILWRVGSNIAINSVRMAITTKSSISVNPFGLRMTDHSPFSVRKGFS